MNTKPYILVSEDTPEEFENKMNSLAAEGYVTDGSMSAVYIQARLVQVGTGFEVVGYVKYTQLMRKV